jgi:lysozyme
MIKGIDVSHWQGTIDWKKVDASFAILKCTESTTYVDPTFTANKAAARA